MVGAVVTSPLRTRSGMVAVIGTRLRAVPLYHAAGHAQQLRAQGDDSWVRNWSGEA